MKVKSVKFHRKWYGRSYCTITGTFDDDKGAIEVHGTAWRQSRALKVAKSIGELFDEFWS